MNDEIPQFLSLDEVASRLGVNRRTIEREIQRGKFPQPFRFGAALRVLEADVAAYTEQRRVKVAPHQNA